jgi:hypothetical protein
MDKKCRTGLYQGEKDSAMTLELRVETQVHDRCAAIEVRQVLTKGG